MLVDRSVRIGAFVLFTAVVSSVQAQDIPGIEICTAEKTMERRTIPALRWGSGVVQP